MTRITHEQREQLKAFATGDIDRAQHLSTAMPDEDWSSYRLLHAALFAVLLNNHFQGDLSPQIIADFVDGIRRDYKAANIQFNSWTVEGILRATAGEEHLFEYFSSEDVISTQTIVVGRLTSYDQNVSDNIDVFLDDAEALIAKWEQGDQ
ncbi:hypothetical protein [Glycomyces arizonensis]|uniref:hypothetical protein n=1 Tax=Glycomyces arizonensis TaxID=256035 RepID=UPI000416AB04|nr:hypothetical protein [Glycomyces arizonensis]